MEFDTLVRGGTVQTAGELVECDVGIVDGSIASVEPRLGASGREEIDAGALHVLPGCVDVHVHFNEPGRTDWEGFATGSEAAAAGGTTCVVDMPLNAHPPTVDAEAFRLKLAAAEAASRVDFALWGGLVPGNVEQLEELAMLGVVGFKAFMCSSGIEDFEAVDDVTLREGMARAAELGLPVAVHAESAEITVHLAGKAAAEGRCGWRDYARSRPVEAELDAISRALAVAEETGCSLHVVHVSSSRGVGLVAEARARGVDATCETCPHYLLFDEDDLVELGAVAKCAPPLRVREEVDALWDELRSGAVDLIASDHSPAPASMKAGHDAFAIWGGISGCQSLLASMLTGGLERGMELATLGQLVSARPAERFHLPHKGHIEPGFDADLCLVDLDAENVLDEADLRYRHRHSPYVGRRFRGCVVRTLVRGQTVWRDGAVVGTPSGRPVRPER
jgi:allantoinase